MTSEAYITLLYNFKENIINKIKVKNINMDLNKFDITI